MFDKKQFKIAATSKLTNSEMLADLDDIFDKAVLLKSRFAIILFNFDSVLRLLLRLFKKCYIRNA